MGRLYIFIYMKWFYTLPPLDPYLDMFPKSSTQRPKQCRMVKDRLLGCDLSSSKKKPLYVRQMVCQQQKFERRVRPNGSSVLKVRNVFFGCRVLAPKLGSLKTGVDLQTMLYYPYILVELFKQNVRKKKNLPWHSCWLGLKVRKKRQSTAKAPSNNFHLTIWMALISTKGWISSAFFKWNRDLLFQWELTEILTLHNFTRFWGDQTV